jgi:hypothetical protein
MSTRALFVLLLIPIASPADDVEEIWDVACTIVAEQHALTCDEVTPPTIELRKDPEAPLGEYVGGDLIYLDTALDGINRDWILVHEMTHYIFSALGVLPLPNHYYIACPSEAVAFAASNAYLASLGYGRLAKEEWIDEYPHCSWMQRSLALVSRRR